MSAPTAAQSAPWVFAGGMSLLPHPFLCQTCFRRSQTIISWIFPDYGMGEQKPGTVSVNGWRQEGQSAFAPSAGVDPGHDSWENLFLLLITPGSPWGVGAVFGYSRCPSAFWCGCSAELFKMAPRAAGQISQERLDGFYEAV